MSTSAYLNELERKSIYIIREAYWQYRDSLALLWSMGKDSTTLVHLTRKAFLGDVLIPVIHIDTTFKFQAIYDFRDAYAQAWRLDLMIARNDAAISQKVSPAGGRAECCHALKTEALKQIMVKYDFKALLLAIRRDEHAIRAKERYFSVRSQSHQWDYHDQPVELWAEYFKTEAGTGTHFRIHPLLHWREIDVWEYIKRERLPVVPLYFSRQGKRYRSIGCQCCCQPVTSLARTVPAVIQELKRTELAERSGRAQDKEKEFTMQKLRALGYM